MPDDQADDQPQWNADTAVPLFPLPNVVLFPRAVLPLHIFEERYKSMMTDALRGPRQVAMALLRPGWEKNYHGSAAIEPVVCVGNILAHERLPDGKYNLLLQGIARATVVREMSPRPYRLAELAPLLESQCLEIDLSNQRRHLISIFSNGRFSEDPLCRKFLEMLSGSVPTREVTDLIVFNLVDDVALKQQLLSEPDPRRRAERIAGLFDRMQILHSGKRGRHSTDAGLN